MVNFNTLKRSNSPGQTTLHFVTTSFSVSYTKDDLELFKNFTPPTGN